MKEVEGYGSWLCVRIGEPFYSKDIERAFNDLMLLQFKFRLAAEESAAKIAAIRSDDDGRS